MQNSSTGLVASIALLMIAASGLVGGFSGTGAMSAQANAFALNAPLQTVQPGTPEFSPAEGQYVRIYIGNTLYEGTLHPIEK